MLSAAYARFDRRIRSDPDSLPGQLALPLSRVPRTRAPDNRHPQLIYRSRALRCSYTAVYSSTRRAARSTKVKKGPHAARQSSADAPSVRQCLRFGNYKKEGPTPLRRDDHRITYAACCLVRWAYVVERDDTGSHRGSLEGEQIDAARPDN